MLSLDIQEKKTGKAVAPTSPGPVAQGLPGCGRAAGTARPTRSSCCRSASPAWTAPPTSRAARGSSALRGRGRHRESRCPSPGTQSRFQTAPWPHSAGPRPVPCRPGPPSVEQRAQRHSAARSEDASGRVGKELGVEGCGKSAALRGSPAERQPRPPPPPPLPPFTICVRPHGSNSEGTSTQSAAA